VEELQIQLRRHTVRAWHHRWIAITVAWTICIAGWIVVSIIPNSFEANARLYIDADEVLTPLLKGLALDNSLGNQIDVLQRTLLSRPNLEKLISKTDLELSIRGPSDLELLVAELGAAIHIVPQTKSLFSITYRNAKPQLAFDVVSTIVNIFVESKTGNNRSDMQNARQFMSTQIAGYEGKLREAESKRAEFRSKYIDLLPLDGGGSSRLDTARAVVRSLEGQLADAAARRGRLAQELAVTPQTIVTETDPGVPAGSSRGGGELAAAERHLQELLLGDTDQHPDVLRQRRLIEQLRSSGGGSSGVATSGRAARSRSQPNTVYDQLKVLQVQADSDVDSLRRQVTDATHERDRLEEIARNVPGVQAQYVNLDRDYDVVRKNYDELVARRESMQLLAAADSGSDKVKLQVIDPPQVPRIPVGPRRILLLSSVLLAGLGGAVASAMLLSQLDRSFHSVRDLRGLGLPVAGGVSLLAGTPRHTAPDGFVVMTVATALLLLGGVYGGLLFRVMQATPT
jgi:polysaccharide chain length determinant protein (PEP-CTERM system associated)